MSVLEGETAEGVVEQAAGIEIAQAEADAKGSATYEPTPFDDLAREMGWSPPDEYTGKPEKWKPAKDYIKYGVQGTEKLRREFKEVKAAAETIARTGAAITQKALAEQREALEAKFSKAVEDGDPTAARKVTKDIEALERSAAAPRDYEADFKQNNPWFGVDDEATAYAVSVSQRLATQGKTPEEQLIGAETSVKKRFPELFDEAPPARKAPLVATPTSRTSTMRREKGFDELPADAKAAWANFDKQFKRAGHADGYPKADYAKEFWANASG